MFNNQRTKRTFRFFDRAVIALNFIRFADYSDKLFRRQPPFFIFSKLFFVSIIFKSGCSALFFFVFLKQCAAEVGFIRRLFGNVKHLFHFFFTFLKKSSKSEDFCDLQDYIFLLNFRLIGLLNVFRRIFAKFQTCFLPVYKIAE